MCKNGKGRSCGQSFFKLIDRLGFPAVLKCAELVVVAVFLYFVLEFNNLIDLQCWIDLPPLYTKASPVLCSELNIPYIRSQALVNLTLYDNVLDLIFEECNNMAPRTGTRGKLGIARNSGTAMVMVLGGAAIVILTLIALIENKGFKTSKYRIHVVQWVFFVTALFAGSACLLYLHVVVGDPFNLGADETLIGTYCTIPYSRTEVLVNFAWLFYIVAGFGTLVYIGSLIHRHCFSEDQNIQDESISL